MRQNSANSPEKVKDPVLQDGLKALGIGGWQAIRVRGRLFARLVPPFPKAIASLGPKSFDWPEKIHPADRGSFAAWMEKLKAGSAANASIDYRLELKPGRFAWVRHWLRLEKKRASNDGLNSAQFSGLIQIIDEQKLAAAAGLQAVENERFQLGQALHDDTCQLLAGLACLTKALASRDFLSLPEVKPLLKDLEQQLSASLERIRVRSHSLVPAPSISEGLAASIRKLAAQMRLLYGVKIELKLPSRLHRHSEDRVVQLHGIAHESIANAIKHGHASSLRITLRSHGKKHVFEISDDGRGLRSSHRASGGIGLHLMKHRAASIGATLVVKNRRPRGACVQVNYTVA